MSEELRQVLREIVIRPDSQGRPDNRFRIAERAMKKLAEIDPEWVKRLDVQRRMAERKVRF